MTGLQSAPCGYFAFDDARRITTANDDALHYLGYLLEEVVGQSLSLLLPPAVRILFHTSVYPALAEGRRVEEIYALLRTKNGEDLPVLLNAARRNQGEDSHQTECIFLAVKRRNLFERHLQRLEITRGPLAASQHDAPPPHGSDAPPDNAQARAQREVIERMSTLGLLLAGVMHEVRNPLTYVQGNLDLLNAELDANAANAAANANVQQALNREVVQECVSEARFGAARILELVRAVALVSRVESSGPMPVDLARVVDAAVRLVHHRIDPFARVQVEGDRPGPTVLAEEARLAQVVMNLLVNAGQAMQGVSKGEAQVRVCSFVERQHAIVTVSDNGPGVPEALRERIFEPFYTTKPIGEGTGLGLPISREIITSFGGSLELFSPPGGGATFRIALPLDL